MLGSGQELYIYIFLTGARLNNLILDNVIGLNNLEMEMYMWKFSVEIIRE